MQFKLFASIYESPEVMQNSAIRDFALEVENNSASYEFTADSLNEAVREFQNSEEFWNFVSQFNRPVYTYTYNQEGHPVRI